MSQTRELLKSALDGNEMSLIELTYKIQNHQLSNDLVKEIANKQTDNNYLKYLQACIYAFGSETIPPDPNKCIQLINALLDEKNKSITNYEKGWILNLNMVLIQSDPENYHTNLNQEEVLSIIQSIGNVCNNPLAQHYFGLHCISENKFEAGINILSSVYHRLNAPLQKEILEKVHQIESNEGLLRGNSLSYCIAQFYDKIDQPEEAYFFHLKNYSSDKAATSALSLEACKQYIEKSPENILIKILKNNLRDLEDIHEEFANEIQELNKVTQREEFIYPNKESIKEAIKTKFSGLDEKLAGIYLENDIISGRFSRQKDFYHTEIGKLANTISQYQYSTKKIASSRISTVFVGKNLLVEHQLTLFKTQNELLKKENKELKANSNLLKK